MHLLLLLLLLLLLKNMYLVCEIVSVTVISFLE